MQENEQEEKWNLAAKFLTGGLEEEDKTKWEALKTDSKFQEDFIHLQKYWNKFETLPYEQINIGEDWNTVWNSAQEKVKPVRKFSASPLLKYAAVVVVTLVFSYLLWMIMANGFTSFTGNDSLTTIEAPSGSTSYVTLPDHSKVWLNAGSKISFGKNYGKDNRNITLEGEAFFDVVKNKTPFHVFTEDQDITVLGTTFNVKAYKEDEKVTTTLVRGSLKVKPNAPASEEYLLKPDEKLVLWKTRPEEGSEQAKLQKQVDTETETGWKNGWLAVRGESLDELARKIERLHDVKIIFANEELKKYKFTGRIKQLSLEQVLRAMALTSPIEFQIDEKTVTLRENTSTKSKYRSLEKSKVN